MNKISKDRNERLKIIMRKDEEIEELPKALRKDAEDKNVKKKTKNWKKVWLTLIILAIIGTSSGGFLLY